VKNFTVKPYMSKKKERIQFQSRLVDFIRARVSEDNIVVQQLQRESTASKFPVEFAKPVKLVPLVQKCMSHILA
jgi:hypothetical protein